MRKAVFLNRIFAEIERPRCHDYLDYQGKKQELKAKGLLATCIQHELDHLNGILLLIIYQNLDMIIKNLKI